MASQNQKGIRERIKRGLTGAEWLKQVKKEAEEIMRNFPRQVSVMRQNRNQKLP